MIDLSGQLEVFVITNGRSTYPYAQKSVDSQEGVKFKVSIHKDMEWLAANQKILEDCQSRFFVRVDDDMLLNSRCIHYMWHCICNQDKKIAMKQWRLWEPYSDKVCKGIKVYTLNIAKKIGFRISKIGKIDKMFKKDAIKKKYKIISPRDVLAIHCCSTYEEHLKYSLMRGEDKGDNFHEDRKFMKKHIGRYKISLEKQYQMRDKFLRILNKKQNNSFYGFLENV